MTRSSGVTRRRFLRTTAASGLGLAAGVPLLSGCAEDSVNNPGGFNLLWVALSVSGLVRKQDEPIPGVTVSFSLSNNAEFADPVWTAPVTTRTSSTGFYEFRNANGAWYVLPPLVDDPFRDFFVWFRLIAQGGELGVAEVTRKEIRRPSRTPPETTAPFEYRVDLFLPSL